LLLGALCKLTLLLFVYGNIWFWLSGVLNIYAVLAFWYYVLHNQTFKGTAMHQLKTFSRMDYDIPRTFPRRDVGL